MTEDRIVLVHHLGESLAGLPAPAAQYINGHSIVSVWELEGDSPRLYYMLVAGLVDLLDADELHAVPEGFERIDDTEYAAHSIYALQAALKDLGSIATGLYHPYFQNKDESERIGAYNSIDDADKTWPLPQYVRNAQGQRENRKARDRREARPAGLPERKATAAEVSAWDHLTAAEAGEKLGLAASTVTNYRSQIRRGVYVGPFGRTMEDEELRADARAKNLSAAKAMDKARKPRKTEAESVRDVIAKRDAYELSKAKTVNKMDTDAALVEVTYGLPRDQAKALINALSILKDLKGRSPDLYKFIDTLSNEHVSKLNT